MFGRLGFVGRVSAILMLALVALWALGAGLSYVSRSPIAPLPSALPLPHQMAAIVDLLEKSDEAQRQTVLAAVSTDTLYVSLSPSAPEVPADIRRLRGIEWLINRYVGALGSREIIATADPDAIGDWQLGRGKLWRLAQFPLRVAVGLKGGGYAVFETRGEIARRLFGMPPGFWVGVLGSLVGIAALFAVWREARPLKALSASVARFARDGQPNLVEMRGAPELRRLIEEVNRMQERIATLIKGRTVLLGAVSHDIKTYITRLKLRTEMIEDGDQRARAERDLDEMTALIDDALAVARGMATERQLNDVDLGEVLRIVVQDYSGVSLTTPEGALMMRADPVALRRLFSNLVDNAVRYGGGGPDITVSAGHEGWRVTVDDDGPGIPAAERALVLEPFYRRETSRSRETGGSGLGLAIAKQIVEAHGGTIALDQSPAGGLRVVLELPAR